MDELEDDVQDFNADVNGYLTNTIPLLTKRLIACINRSIAVAEIDVRAQYQAIDFDNLESLFSEGDNDIDEIRELLDKLEAYSP